MEMEEEKNREIEKSLTDSGPNKTMEETLPLNTNMSMEIEYSKGLSKVKVDSLAKGKNFDEMPLGGGSYIIPEFPDGKFCLTQKTKMKIFKSKKSHSL